MVHPYIHIRMIFALVYNISTQYCIQSVELLTRVLVCVSVELSDSSQPHTGEIGQCWVRAGVVVTLHDVERQRTRVASHLPHWDCVCACVCVFVWVYILI